MSSANLDSVNAGALPRVITVYIVGGPQSKWQMIC
jgi:hypothetical protein